MLQAMRRPSECSSPHEQVTEDKEAIEQDRIALAVAKAQITQLLEAQVSLCSSYIFMCSRFEVLPLS